MKSETLLNNAVRLRYKLDAAPSVDCLEKIAFLHKLARQEPGYIAVQKEWAAMITLIRTNYPKLVQEMETQILMKLWVEQLYASYGRIQTNMLEGVEPTVDRVPDSPPFVNMYRMDEVEQFAKEGEPIEAAAACVKTETVDLKRYNLCAYAAMAVWRDRVLVGMQKEPTKEMISMLELISELREALDRCADKII